MTWQESWRIVAQQLSTKHLEALHDGLSRDDPGLVQGKIVVPPGHAHGETPTAACAIGYCGWRGDGLVKVEDVWLFFLKITEKIKEYGEFLRWFDQTQREEMRHQLLSEVRRELAIRNLETVDIGGEG